MNALATINNPNPADGDRAWRYTFSAERDAWLPVQSTPETHREARQRVAAPEPGRDTAAALLPMRSGPCIPPIGGQWQSHARKGPRGRCERCLEELP